MKRSVVGVVVTLLLTVAAAGCSDSEIPDEEPGLDRIDGPAQVDPSYDPFAVDTTTVP